MCESFWKEKRNQENEDVRDTIICLLLADFRKEKKKKKHPAYRIKGQEGTLKGQVSYKARNSSILAPLQQ